jgi:hypothetical protein
VSLKSGIGFPHFFLSFWILEIQPTFPSHGWTKNREEEVVVGAGGLSILLKIEANRLVVAQLIPSDHGLPTR